MADLGGPGGHTATYVLALQLLLFSVFNFYNIFKKEINIKKLNLLISYHLIIFSKN